MVGQSNGLQVFRNNQQFPPVAAVAQEIEGWRAAVGAVTQSSSGTTPFIPMEFTTAMSARSLRIGNCGFLPTTTWQAERVIAA